MKKRYFPLFFAVLVLCFASVAQARVPDSDGDGIPDDVDACPNSNLSATVVIDSCDSGVENTLFSSGCTFSDLIQELADAAVNRGEFVSSVAGLTNNLRSSGIITGQQKSAIHRCAVQPN